MCETKYFRNLYYLIPILLILSSCLGKSTAEKRAEQEKKQISEDIRKVVVDLPHPTVVPIAISKIGAEFDPGLISEIRPLETYLTNKDKAAMNLGVFSADIGYLIAYDKVDVSVDHMRTCNELANNIGVPTTFNLETIQKFQNASNHQELLQLWDDNVLSWEQHFDSAARQSMAALVLTGSFVEEMYIIVKVAETYHTDDMDAETRDKILEPIVKLLLRQEEPLVDIIQLLRHLPADEAIGKMIAELSILERLFQGDLADVQQGIEQNPDFVINQDMLFDIRLEINRIREEIVGVES